MAYTKKNNGFTLLELAISVVIIGLIVGSTMVGRSLIKSSELQSVITDFNRYKDAIKLFKDKYHELPGDMTNATSFWGAASATNCTASLGAAKNTCNGDGDGFVGVNTLWVGDPQTGGNTEPLLVWQHLALSGIIDNVGTIGYTASGANLAPGTNIPASKMADAGFYLRYSQSGVLTGLFDADYQHVIILGGANGSALTPPISARLKPSEAANIDQKMDDGKPATGKVMTFTSDIFPDCVSGNTATATYKETINEQECALIFRTGF